MLQGVVRVFDGYLSGVAEVSSAVETWAVVGAADWFVVQVTALRVAGASPKVQVGAVSSVDGAQFKSPDFVDVDLANTALVEAIFGEPLDDSPRGAYTKFVLRMHQPDGVALVRLDVGLRRRERLPLGTPIGGDLGGGCGCRADRPDHASSGRAPLPGGLPPGAQLIDGPTPHMDPVSPPAFRSPTELLGRTVDVEGTSWSRIPSARVRCTESARHATARARCVGCDEAGGECRMLNWGPGPSDYAYFCADPWRPLRDQVLAACGDSGLCRALVRALLDRGEDAAMLVATPAQEEEFLRRTGERRCRYRVEPGNLPWRL